jgi:hypothetical protein
MKNLTVILLLLIPLVAIKAQETQKSREEIRAEKKLQKRGEIKNLVDNKTFVFNAEHAMPMGGSTINLNYHFNAKVDNDTVVSYLPFYGVAYTAEYGSRNSPFDFAKPMENYKSEKDKKGYRISFDVKNKSDYLKYNFLISESGYATLHVTSTNRQFISFRGTVEKIDEI